MSRALRVAGVVGVEALLVWLVHQAWTEWSTYPGVWVGAVALVLATVVPLAGCEEVPVE